jgi:hypothetical protein
MGISTVLLNETKKEFLMPMHIGDDADKPGEIASNWNSPITMQQALYLLTNPDASRLGVCTSNDIKNKTKLFQGFETIGRWYGDKISWSALDWMHNKKEIKKGTKNYKEITELAHNIVENKDNIKSISGKEIKEDILINPYKSIGEEVRNMFEFYYADYNIRGYQIGIPDVGDIDEERYFKIKFCRNTAYDRFRRDYTDTNPLYRYTFKYVEAPYKGGRAHFFGSMIDTSTKEGQDKIKDAKKISKII